MSWVSSRQWVWVTVLLYAAAATVGLVATLGSFDRGLDIGLVVWTFGMIAAFFAVALAGFGLLAFLRRDDDRTDTRSFTGVVLFLVSSTVTTGGSGLIASGLLLVAWLFGRFVGRRHRRAWRNEFAERQAFFRRLGKSDPRDDPEAERFLGKEPSASERQEALSSDGYAVTRWELRERARKMDQDPWQAPPE